MTTTHWYQLVPHQTAAALCDGKHLYGHEFEVASHCEHQLLEVNQAVEGGGVFLARSLHEAMTCVTALLRQKVAEVEQEHVAVLIRLPLTVMVADMPPRVATDDCRRCAGCQTGGDCTERVWVLDEDGKPLTLPGTLGYRVFAIVALIGSQEPITMPPDTEVISIDAEPPWMNIPDLDVKRVREHPWRSLHGRLQLADMLMPKVTL